MNHTQMTLATLALAACGSTFAQVAIDQNKALAGNITPGDAAGFPITISQPGHYKLTGHLVVPATLMGIKIDAEDVTLDLNGFSIRGQVQCNNSGTAAKAAVCTDAGGLHWGVQVLKEGARVRNGTISSFRTGVGLSESAALSDLELHDMQLNGIYSTSPSLVQVERTAFRRMGEGAIKNIGGPLMMRELRVLQAGYGISAGGAIGSVLSDSFLSTNALGVYGVAMRNVRFVNNTVAYDSSYSLGGNLLNSSVTPF